jgi:hypothetical protein
LCRPDCADFDFNPDSDWFDVAKPSTHASIFSFLINETSAFRV